MKKFLQKISTLATLVALLFTGSQGFLSLLQVSTVQAQSELAFELEIWDTQERTLGIPAVYDFPRPAEVISVFSTYCCFFGSISLSLEGIVVNEQEKTLHACSRCGNDSEWVLWEMPPGTIADRIDQGNVIMNGEVTFIDLLGELTNTVIRDDLAKELDRVGEVANTVGVQELEVRSSNPQVIVWLGGPTDYTKQRTTTFTDKIYACADEDQNGTCDFLGLACSDGIDNDGNGKIDFPDDIGCTSPTDNDETDPPHCKDGLDNDGDGQIDLADEGCENPDDTDERNPACSDGNDNDGDGFTDHPDDIGCESRRDNDEVNPPIDRNITLSKTNRPALIFQPVLQTDEVINLIPPCGTCTVSATPDPGTFAVGQQAASIISIQDSADNSTSYAILLIGAYEEATDLTTRQGKPYQFFR